MGKLNIPLNIQRFGGSWGFSEAYCYDYNTTSNTNWIYCKIAISTNSSTYNNSGSAYCKLTANASNGGGYYEQTQYFNIGKGSTVYLDFWMGPFNHNVDGTLPSITLGGNIYVVSNTQFTITGNLYPNTINRYANITQFDVSSTLEGIQVTWDADAYCDAMQYSLNGGGWVNGTHPTTYISGLSPETTNTIKITVRRMDSQLWTESATKTIDTKSIAKITSCSDFNFGDSTYISKTNNSGVSDQFRLELPDYGITVVKRTGVSNTFTLTLTDDEWDTIYKKLGNNNSIRVRFVVDTLGDYGTYANWADRTLTLKGNQKTIREKISGSWKRGKVWLKVNNSWKRGVVWQNVNGTWKRSI